ncbi:MAG TPA: response regulator [Prolixibacteraceae bacterium]
MRALNILVAEDDDQNQAMMKLILIRQGHKVKSAWNGRAALEAVKSEDFDLIFMDVQMPEMDGLETTRQIRKWENNQRHVSIVILTGSVPEKISDEYKKAGADTFLLKPFDIKRIGMLLEIFAGEPAIGQQENLSQLHDNNSMDVPVLDMQDSISRFNNDTKYYLENLQEFLQSMPERLERMDQALKAHNWQSLSTYAHNLKGVAANFGAKQLSILAASLDDLSDHHEFKKSSKIYREIKDNYSMLTEMANKIIAEQSSPSSGHQGGQ